MGVNYSISKEVREVIYADNAATTRLDIESFEAMKPFLLDDYSNPSQPYTFSRKAKKALVEARKTIADCIGADPEEIFFTSCGTESDNWAIKNGSLNGDILTSQIEHHAILNSCRKMESEGKKVGYIPVNSLGIVDLEWLEKNISSSTALISVMFANNEIGTIQPVKEIANIVHKHGCIFHTDAVQAVGHIDINVKEMGIDMLSASAHKFNGPKGIGFLYVKKGLSISSFIDGGSQENGLRAGTENVASIVGMATALRNNIDNISENTEKIEKMSQKLIDGLIANKLDFIRNGATERAPGNISLSFNNFSGEMILHRLDLMGICVSTGSACDGNSNAVSHVLEAIKLDKKYAEGTIRISLGKDNSEEDIEKIISGISKIVHR